MPPRATGDEGLHQKVTKAKLHICVTCKSSLPADAEAKNAVGRQLYEAMRSLAGDFGDDAPVEVRPVACLANCDHACSASISATGKWTYLLRDLNAEMAADLMTYCETYQRSETGNVFRSRRPSSMHSSIAGRVPSTGMILPNTEFTE
ncbi:putative metal-binding protein [Rhodoligotrophos appendicifer]|uniref:DUF1636 family protein n=1 Tax=Rhodoligotrophos appendicifer TaxID=987056 RepID=UPI001478C457